MPIVSQGTTQEFRVGATDGIFVKCTGSAAITYDGEYSAPTLADTSTGEVRCGYFGAPATIRVNCVSGTCEVNTQPTIIKPLVSKQGGAAQDSSALDVAQTVNGLVDLAPLIKTPSPDYWLHFNADAQLSGDRTVHDQSGAETNGWLGENLTSAESLVNSRALSTKTPSTGQTDSVIRFPILNYDYTGQESMLLFFRGRIATVATNTVFMGDTISTSSNGISFRIRPTGQVDFFIADSTGALFAGPTTATIYNADLNSFALLIDGKNKMYKWYVNGTQETGLIAYGNQSNRNTLSNNTWNVGSGSAYPGGTAGIQTIVNTLAIFRGFGDVDEIAANNLVQALQNDGSRLISGSIFK